jgi:hypothetical protein
MIKIFEQFNEIDPYGEENWSGTIDQQYNFAIGDFVIVPDPNEDDIHENSFVGYITEFRNGNAVVEDQEGDSFEIELDRLRRGANWDNEYESAFNEFDPYGEENWGHEPNEGLNPLVAEIEDNNYIVYQTTSGYYVKRDIMDVGFLILPYEDDPAEGWYVARDGGTNPIELYQADLEKLDDLCNDN